MPPPVRGAYALARDFPRDARRQRRIDTLEEAAGSARGRGATRRGRLAGTMIGRAAHADPWGVLSDADVRVFGPMPTRGRQARPAERVRQVLRRDARAFQDDETGTRAEHTAPDAPAAEFVFGRAQREGLAAPSTRRSRRTPGTRT